jgi:hypothetical protein
MSAYTVHKRRLVSRMHSPILGAGIAVEHCLWNVVFVVLEGTTEPLVDCLAVWS